MLSYLGGLVGQLGMLSDYFLLDQELVPDEVEIRNKVRRFAESEVAPIINEYWEEGEFPFQVLGPLSLLNVAGGFIEGYGCPGLSRRATGIVARELSRVDGSLNTFFGAHSSLSMGAIYLLGSEDQRKHFLPTMARMERLGAFALTEPDHGSDSVALETSARWNGKQWVLNGRKRWIGNGHIADVTVLFARDVEDGQVKAFVVEKDSEGCYPAGYEPDVIQGKVAKRSINQADIVLHDVRVEAVNRLVHCDSFHDVTRVLKATRGGASWEAVGHGMAAFEIAADYAREREQFGAPIASYQLVQERLATMLSDLTTMQLLCMRMATLAEREQLTEGMASLVKMSTSRKALAICRMARDMMGGNGLLLENHVGRHLTDMEVVSTYEGTDSVQSLLVGREITGISAFTRSGRANRR